MALTGARRGATATRSFFNFSPDRAREITRARALPAFAGFDRGAYPAGELLCLTEYDL